MIPFLPINFDIFSMDAIIYGGFFGLSLGAVAFNYMAKNTGLCATLLALVDVTYIHENFLGVSRFASITISRGKIIPQIFSLLSISQLVPG